MRVLPLLVLVLVVSLVACQAEVQQDVVVNDPQVGDDTPAVDDGANAPSVDEQVEGIQVEAESDAEFDVEFDPDDYDY